MSNQQSSAIASWYRQLNQLMSDQQVDVVLITSRDGHLSEYTALVNNPRYQLTGFDGSVGDALVFSAECAERCGLSAQCILFVDGRYHLQADQQTDPQYVEVYKLDYGQQMWKSMVAWIEKHRAQINKIGFDGFRLSSFHVNKLTSFAEQYQLSLHCFNRYEIDQAIALPGLIIDKPIYQLANELLGRNIQTNIDRLTASYPLGFEAQSTCYVTAMCDDVAYLLNSRGYHGPNASSHFGYLFVIGYQLVLFLPRDCADSPVEFHDLEGVELTVIRNDWSQLQQLLGQYPITGVCYQAKGINYALQQVIDNCFAGATCFDEFKGVTPIRVVKSPEELAAMRQAFSKSSQAIATTIRWAKYGDPEDHIYTEGSLSQKIWQEYQDQGALSLSFNTIAGTGANGALIHYSDDTSTQPLQDGELVILDSGAYYQEGLATDVTRGCFCNHSRQAVPQAWQKAIYTATLKASVAGLTACLHHKTTGAEFDQMIRQRVQQAGFDYAHGTGHGVGIDVHEGGIGISPRNNEPLTEQAVVTIEPGVYLPDQGGVRVENVVIVKRDEFKPDHFVFENLVFVGYDWELIDVEQLDDQEKEYLKRYEYQCQQMGTSITACPLF